MPGHCCLSVLKKLFFRRHLHVHIRNVDGDFFGTNFNIGSLYVDLRQLARITGNINVHRRHFAFFGYIGFTGGKRQSCGHYSSNCNFFHYELPSMVREFNA
eukprot:TRINITY_DN34349_c0_g1_i1.p1 TRINITY_DN34349_c0_g1~~TRINITY_DN34349_c0_g1_i1.p1  ORF type:complete len:101 (-),score=8.56 TRINITY_DN34349_c0_g1_i1:79-381(-)